MMEALIGWPVEATTLEAVGMKNCLLHHMGRLGRFALTRMQTESSLGSDPLGSVGRMPSGRDSPSLPMFGCPFQPSGLNLWLARMGTEV